MEPLRALDIVLEPSSFLDEQGMDVVHTAGHWTDKGAATLKGLTRRLRDLNVARRYDLVLVHRESMPIGPAWVERMLRMMRIPYAFDFDDAIYLANASTVNRRLVWLKGAHKTVTAAGLADMVLAGNPYLAQWAERIGAARVVVVPSTIDTGLYRPAGFGETGAPLCVGWSGSATTIEHLRLIEPTLRELQRERGIRIRVIGEPSYRIDGAAVETLPWRAATEVDDLRPIDIGVMPLPDDEWTRGKCGMKALQYMALGIPTVLSPVGVNRGIARDGAALLASSPSEWGRVLRQLLDDRDLRGRVGRAGRARVEHEYSVSATLPIWENVLRTAAVSRGREPRATHGSSAYTITR